MRTFVFIVVGYGLMVDGVWYAFRGARFSEVSLGTVAPLFSGFAGRGTFIG